MDEKQRYGNILEWFQDNMPAAQSELNYSNAFELLIAVILSAQCTDKRVNMVTPELFRAFPTPESLAGTTVEDVLQYIKTVSYPNSKAKYLVGMAKSLTENYKGQIPAETSELQKLPGVGRKTANVIASIVYNKPAMAVDTHVFRVANRTGLTHNSRTPLETEKTLVANIPRQLVPRAHHWLILHGRYVCTAKNPKCHLCGISKWCEYYLK
jgi:endonuclease-3